MSKFAGLQRLVGEKAERHDEENARATGSPARAAGTASAPGDGERSPRAVYPEMRFCQAVRYFWLFSAFESKIFTLSSIFCVGKMRVFFATAGSNFFAHSPAPATGRDVVDARDVLLRVAGLHQALDLGVVDVVHVDGRRVDVAALRDQHVVRPDRSAGIRDVPVDVRLLPSCAMSPDHDMAAERSPFASGGA